MKYDFTTMVDRAGRDSLAMDIIPLEGVSIEEGFSRIPMWVADMSFPTAPPVLDAIEERLKTPTMGYFLLTDEYYGSIISWQQRRNGVEGLTKEHIGYENGVLGGVSSAIRALTSPGDKILVHSPTYIGFTHVCEEIGRTLVHSPLVRDEKGVWRMDYADMDAKLKENGIHLAIFCSPHNPCGRVWEKWEIEKAMQVYSYNNCYVISDEIWSDIIAPGNKHIPTQSVSEDARQRTMAFYSPSKTFSLAGLIGSYHIIYNDFLRSRVAKLGSESHYNSCNVLSMHGLIGAYSAAGEQWADEMNAVIAENCRYAVDFINENFPGVKVFLPQGTYMLYLDCAQWLSQNGTGLSQLLRRGAEKGVIWQNGESFMLENSIRMNLALPKAQLEEAFDRLKKYAFV